MRILKVHNRYQIRGGEEETTDAENHLLEQMGHKVSYYNDWNDRIATQRKGRMAVKTIWSKAAYLTMKQRFEEQAYDIMHVHNFFPLISPSIYYAARKAGVPVVQTLHNYRLLCPNALFFREGNVCEDCLGKAIPWPAVQHNCYRQSKVASSGVALMLTVHRLLKTCADTVDLYIALTEFARQKFIEGGFPAEKIVVKPNFVYPEPPVGEGGGGFALYVGRLSVEKGLDTLIAAWQKLGHRIPLKIVGDGPLADLVIEASKQSPTVEWLGRKPMSEVHELMGQASFLVFPSKWYETFGRVAVEAFAKGTPVLASNIGAIAELVSAERTGLLFKPGDPDDLVAKVDWMLVNQDRLTQMRQEARREFEMKYTAKQNYQQLMAIYKRVQPDRRSTGLCRSPQFGES